MKAYQRIIIITFVLVFLSFFNNIYAVEFTWNKTFGNGGTDEGMSVQQTFDGGYIITGWTNSYGEGNYDVWLIKTDVNGDIEPGWPKTFGGSNEDRGYSGQQNSDGSYIITGLTNSYGAGSSDIWLIKTDAYGNMLWDQTFGEAGVEEGWSVQQTSDNGYIITGWTDSFTAYPGDVLLIKTDANGNIDPG